MTDDIKDSGAGASGSEMSDKIMDGNNAGPSGATGPAQSGPAQTGAAQTGAAASGPAGATGPVVPEKYDLKLPEGSLLSAEELGKIESFAKERGLPNKDAQALLDQQSKLLTSYAEGEKSKWGTETAKWPDAVKADPEIGGEAFQQNVELAKRVVTRFGSPTLIKGLSETGFGNHPELVRIFARIGAAMDDDKLVMPGSKSSAATKSMEDVFYPSKSET